jgi:hypothetical protein
LLDESGFRDQHNSGLTAAILLATALQGQGRERAEPRAQSTTRKPISAVLAQQAGRCTSEQEIAAVHVFTGFAGAREQAS